jgi:MSHA pilin protein MshA
MKKYSSNIKGAGGFTLIELIVVIVILGILAAIALPKFSNLSTDARVSQMQAIAASIKAASVMAHGQSLAEQLSPVTSVNIEGAPVTMIGYYPTANAGGIVAALGNSTAAGIATGGALTGPPASLEFYPDAGRTSCKVVYTAAVAATAGGAITPPIIDATAATPANCG